MWLKHVLRPIQTSIFVMVRPIIEEQIAPAEAVARKILRSTEASLMSSVTKIGAGGFGDIYEMCLKKPIADQELEGSHWETPVHVRNVFTPLWKYC